MSQLTKTHRSPSNREFGEPLGISISMASRIRQGKRLPSTHVLNEIAKRYKLPLEDLHAAYEKGADEFGHYIRKNCLIPL